MQGRRHTLPLAWLGLVVAISLPLVLGFLNGLHPAFDSFAHFRAHLAVLLAVSALPLLLTVFRLPGLAAVTLGIGAFATVLEPSALRFSTASQAGSEAAGGATYRLLHMNLRFDNAEPEKVLSLIGRTQPDVIALNEVSPMWREKLTLLGPRYPHGITCPSSGRIGGVAILSRRPLAETREPRCFGEGELAIAAFDFGGKAVDVAALHLVWPWPYGQSQQIERLVPALGSLGETAVLAGDFNATPWSAAVRRVARAGGFGGVERLGPTWLFRTLPKQLRPLVGLPIDQAMSKGRIVMRSARTLEDAGSDHLPVLAEFSVEAGEEPLVLQAQALAE